MYEGIKKSLLIESSFIAVSIDAGQWLLPVTKWYFTPYDGWGPINKLSWSRGE
jgi:hypothetical protein